MKTPEGTPPPELSNPPEEKPEAPAAPPAHVLVAGTPEYVAVDSGGLVAPPTPSPLSASGLASLTEDEASRFQDGRSPFEIKGDASPFDIGQRSEREFLGARYAPEPCAEGKLIAAAILELFKVSGHPVPASLAPGLRVMAERGYLAR